MLANIAGVVLKQGTCDAAIVHRMLEAMPGKVLQTKLQRPSECVTLGWSLLVGEASTKTAVDSGSGVAWLLDGNIDLEDLVLERTRDSGQTLIDELEGSALGQRQDAFALAAYDPRSHQLLLMRDRMGFRSLYWADLEDGGIAFASVPSGLLVYARKFREPERKQLARAIVELPVIAPDSCYRYIHQVPRASTLIWSSGKASVQRYWEPRALSLAGYSDLDLVDRYRSLFQTSVRRALERDRSKIAVTCSGGLDSSSVLGMAAHTKEPGQEIVALTADIGESTLTDTDVAKTLARALRLPWIKFRPEALEPCDELLLGVADPFAAALANLTLEIVRAAAKHGSKIVLTGALGDLVGGIALDWPVETVKRQGPLALWNVFGQRTQHGWRARAKSTAAALWRSGPLAQAPPLPTREQRGFTRSSRRLAELARVDPRTQRSLMTERVRYLRKWRVCPESYLEFGKWVLDVAGDYEFADWDAIGRILSVEVCHPLAHPDLVEFSFSLPWSLRYSSGQTRVALRRAMQGILPAPTLARRPKIPLDEFHLPLMRQSISRLLGSGLGRAAELVDASAWAKMAKFGEAMSFMELSALYNVVLLERWLGLLERRA